MGKPIGNGFPLGAVVTTSKLTESFKTNNNKMEFFNTFGGNPVSCAAGLSVLKVIKEEELLSRATEMGEYWSGKLRQLQRDVNGWKCEGRKQNGNSVKIVDVRGTGLFLGIEFVIDLEKRAPGTKACKWIVDRMSGEPYRVLLGKDGPYNNVVKIKGPLCIEKHDVDWMVECLRRVIGEYCGVRRPRRGAHVGFAMAKL